MRHVTIASLAVALILVATGPAAIDVTPTPASTLAAGPSPTHIATWAYDDGCNGGLGASPQLVRRWVTDAESNCGPDATKAITDCHTPTETYCTSVQYIDPNRVYGEEPVASSAQESWWLHEPGYSDAQHRLSVTSYGGGYLLNQANPAVVSWFHDDVRTNDNAYDALEVDDTSAGLGAELFGTGFSSSAEITTSATLQQAHEQMAAALTHANGTPFLQVNNGISSNPFVPTPFPLLDHPATVNGIIAEDAPEDDGTMTGYYSTLLDEMAYVDHTADDFIVLLSYDPAGSLQSRRVQAATVLLGYSPGHTVSWSDLEQDSADLAVWPEEGIVPSGPLQTMSEPGGPGCLEGVGLVCATGGHGDLQVVPGVYRREYASCDNAGVAFGHCAVVVNSSALPVTVARTWLTLTYHHEITMVGGDVQSGGAIDTAGARFTAGQTTLPAHDALLLAP